MHGKGVGIPLGTRGGSRWASIWEIPVKNANGRAGMQAAKVEHPDTLEYLKRRMAPGELSRLGLATARRLVRMKCLDRWRLFGRFLVVIDATGHPVFTEHHCEHCLVQRQGDREARASWRRPARPGSPVRQVWA